jgi:NAD(P)-dependent dehydrogenase (short-subunit alcohol dehydrogenase family)
MKLEGKVAIVTGAGRGIGRAMSKALAAERASVVLASRSLEPLEETAATIHTAGGEALPFVCDVGVETEVNDVVRTAAETYGRLDILINNAQSWRRPGERAPTTPQTPFAEISEEAWDHTFRTGVKATYYFCKAAFPYLKKRGGKVINFGSPAAILGRPMLADYCANKEAIRGMTRSLAREWGQYGINVNVVCPAIQTEAMASYDKARSEEARKESLKATRSVAEAIPTATLARWLCSSPVLTPTTSPATPSTSTAACSCSDRRMTPRLARRLIYADVRVKGVEQTVGWQ